MQKHCRIKGSCGAVDLQTILRVSHTGWHTTRSSYHIKLPSWLLSLPACVRVFVASLCSPELHRRLNLACAAATVTANHKVFADYTNVVCCWADQRAVHGLPNTRSGQLPSTTRADGTASAILSDGADLTTADHRPQTTDHRPQNWSTHWRKRALSCRRLSDCMQTNGQRLRPRLRLATCEDQCRPFSRGINETASSTQTEWDKGPVL
ncbi:hypothetical protein TcWFU_009786 [Taenia crassiceps]|uniref:Uncharacterized protein n=1 Tax=Taenia crassiceps TaxID=6207 RepID=A0ABR4Q3C4_9CEST